MYVLAPFTPFMAEEYYRKLTGGESVHLQDWLPAGHVNELVVKDMSLVRDYVTRGLSLRATERLKVRQPLASITVPSLGKFVDFEDVLTEELNVKSVIVGKELSLDTVITPELKREGLMREIVRHVQAARKEAGLNVDDRIILVLKTTEEELQKTIDHHTETICAETLATMSAQGKTNFTTSVKVEGMELYIGLENQG